MRLRAAGRGVLLRGGRPVGEGVEAEERDGVGVDGEAEREHADDVHHEPGLHHVRCNTQLVNLSTDSGVFSLNQTSH